MKRRLILVISIVILGMVFGVEVGDFEHRPGISDCERVVIKAMEVREALMEREGVVIVRWQDRGLYLLNIPYSGLWQDYYRGLQREEERVSVMFLDGEAGPLNAGRDGLVYYNLISWREGAGISSNGFRRVRYYDEEELNGVVGGEDLLGEWIYREIEDGYRVLEVSRWPDEWYWLDKERKVASGWYSWMGFLAAWDAAVWVWDSGEPFYDVSAGENSNGGIGAKRVRVSLVLTNLPYFSGGCEVYGLIVSHGNTNEFSDIDGLGVEQGKLYCFDGGIVLSGSNNYYRTRVYNDRSENPFLLLGWVKSEPAINRQAGCRVAGYPHVIIRWLFPHR